MKRISQLMAKAAPIKSKHAFTEFTPMEYLMIDVASNFGLDKQEFATRIKWTQDNKAAVYAMLDEVEAAWLEDRPQLPTLLDQADTPALFFAGAQALRKAEAGQPVSYPISLDATASGIQLLAILAGCRQSASICNVVPTGKRMDAYTHVYNRMTAALGSQGRTDRADVKSAMMTSFYGSTREPKRVFGEGELLELFYTTVEAEAPGAWELNVGLPTLWNPNAYSHDWIMADNFHVKVKVMAPTKEDILFEGSPVTVQFYENRPIPESRSLTPNLIHS